MNLKLKICGVMIGFIAAIIAAPSVLGHAMLVKSDPAAKSKLKEPPSHIQLWFSEDLEGQFSSIVVTDQNGKRVDKNDTSLPEPKRLQVDLEDLTAGTYTVSWKALSTDQHTMKGTFTFTVVSSPSPTQTSTPAGAVVSPKPTASQTPSSTSSPETEAGEVSGSTWGQSFVRWLHYLGMMVLFGGFGLYVTVISPLLRKTSVSGTTGVSEITEFSENRIAFWSWLSLILIFVTSVVGLLQQAASVFDKSISEATSPALLKQVITQTGYGGAWSLELAACAGLLVILLLLGRANRSHRKRGSALWLVGLAIGAILLLGPSWTGHAAAAAGDFRLAVLTDWLHIVAGGFWVGGVFHLALTAIPAAKRFDPRQRAGVVASLIGRFTRVAIPSVAVLVLAGLYNTWVHVPSFQSLWASSYGKTLLLKLVLVAVMLVLGALNNFHFGKKVSSLAPSDKDRLPKLERGFGRSVLLESAFGLAVLLVTAVLVFLTPPRSHPPMANSMQSLNYQSESEKR